jgi:hypothetical protein
MTTKMISEETLQPQAQEETGLRRAIYAGCSGALSRWSSRGTMSGR